MCVKYRPYKYDINSPIKYPKCKKPSSNNDIVKSMKNTPTKKSNVYSI